MKDPEDFIEQARQAVERAHQAQEAIDALGAGKPKPAIDPELAARITSAKAAITDYRREANVYLIEDGSQPDFASWAERFAADLTGIIAWIERQI